MEWLPIEQCKIGEHVLMYYPPCVRRGQIALHEMVSVGTHPVIQPRKPTLFCRYPKPPKGEPVPY